MKHVELALVVALLAVFGSGGCSSCPERYASGVEHAWHKIGADYDNYYSRGNLAPLSVCFGAAAVMAHTDVDQDLQDWWQQDVRSDGLDDFSRVAKGFGDGEYVIAAAGAGLLLRELYPESFAGETTGQWSDRTLRALIVGAPPLLIMQGVTGGSRPGESTAESDWIPFHDTNGVSGHAFVGAVPFISAAQMTDDPCLRATLLFGSTLAALSRVNDDRHYASQAVLGWCMAYAACQSVNYTEQEDRWYEVTPIPVEDGAGVGVIFEY